MLQIIYKKYCYQICIALMWTLAFLIIYPIGEFAINDDWAYTKNVYNLAVNKTFFVDEWPAMNLISQTLFGTLTTSIFGFSFTALRISVFLLSFCSSLYLFKIIWKLANQNNFVAFVFTAAFSFNAIYMHLSFTFMTDVFFISMLIFAINSLINYNSHGKLISYFFFCFWCIIAMLCRQQALIFGLLIIAGVLKWERNNFKRIIMSLLPAFICWLVSDKYRHYLTAYNIRNNIQQIKHLKEYLKDASIDKHFLQGADELLVVGWVVFPICLFLLFCYKSKFTIRDFWVFVIAVVASIVSTIKAFGIYPIGNISNLFEIGPKVIKASSKEISGDLEHLLKILHYLISILSLALVFFFCSQKLKQNSLLVRDKFARVIYVGVSCAYFLFVAISSAYFDRYAAPLIFLIILFIVPTYKIELKRSIKLIVVSFILAVFLFSTIENLDYFNWQKQRLKAICYIHSNGISDEQIDGGFEFNGWVKKDNAYPTDKTLSWWWVVKDNYIVSAKQIAGTTVDSFFVYQRYIPFRKDTIYVLNKGGR